MTGHWPAPEFGLPKLLWVKDTYPDAWRAAQTVLQLHDWFVYRLSGVLASERSSAGMSQLLDVAAGTWAADLLLAVGIRPSVLPDLRPAGSLAGPLLADAAVATGFAAGTPVHFGGGDTHMSVLSATGLKGPGPVVVAGTTAPVVDFARTGELPPDPEALFPLLRSEHVAGGRTILEANAGSTGAVADQLDGLPGPPGDLSSQIAARGARVADGDGAGDDLVVFAGNPFFSPEGWASVPPPTVMGLRDWHTGADVVRACLVGSAYAVASLLETLTTARRAAPAQPVVVTGGMSRSRTWPQLLADVTGRTVTSPALTQVAGRAGALIVAGHQAPGPTRPAGGPTRPIRK